MLRDVKKNDSLATDSVKKNEIYKGEVSMDDVFSDLKKIKSLGFDPLSVEIITDGYRVEGDIRLTKKNLDESVAALSKQQGQYSTKYPLTLERTIKVALDDKSNTVKFKTAFDASILALNNLKLPLKFVTETDIAKADIVTLFKDLGGKRATGVTLGQDGEFVDAKGNPGKEIYLNSNKDAELNNKTTDYLTSIMIHEFGHAIGLRHTDYKNKFYSALSSGGIATDAATQDQYVTLLVKKLIDGKYGIGAWDVKSNADKKTLKETYIKNNYTERDDAGSNSKAGHIYGTPLSPVYGSNITTDPLSVMLAFAGTNFKFSLFDNIALFGLYGNPAQTILIRNSLDENGNVTAAGKTLQQIVDEAKALKF
ncbi:hypothetical protein TH53_05060 [Pedobacter lusitanus]|uniref:Uncharacterized protein n=1 Tax=Pedobacter lusitanus TaxID=1503925 RepID=A0A0D0F8Z7_9SPHI|nr:M57 family metalloprotease [Pedobacter lusitanus]KIO78218.1 hypothetical protein TH53_05060 [Pedobacter lusitanus]